MRRNRLSIIVVLVLLWASILTLPAQGQEAAEFRVPSYELYAPARIVISFVYTNNVSVQVSTLGNSLYKAVTSPVQVEFSTEAFDVYTVNVQILYDKIVNQTITMGLFEGGRAAKGIEFDVNASAVNVKMKVAVVEAPRFPTADEISDRMWERWRNELANFEANVNDLVAKMNSTVLTVGSLSVIAFVVCIVALIATFHVHRRVAELQEWGIRHEAEHRKERSN
ncbi:MAG: hypothetical protein ACPL4I_11410 [Bacteroidota bacterium]